MTGHMEKLYDEAREHGRQESKARITQLEAQLKAAEEAHAEKVSEVARLEAKLFEHDCGGGTSGCQNPRRTCTLCYSVQQRERITRLPRWSLVSEGWPTVEGRYAVLIVRNGGYEIAEMNWCDCANWWTQWGVERYTLVSDLEKLPGGTNER